MPPARRTTLTEALSSIQQDFTLDTPALQALQARFIKLMDYGLAHTGADMAMIPAYVTGVPDGTEKGTYLALDLGGTNLRVCEVTLNGDGTFGMKQEKYKVSDALKRGPIRDLMDYIANSVDTFLTDFGSSEGLDELHMGFTFSFPVEQTAIDRGTLIKWTKGFDCPDAPGKDVIQLLQSSLDRKHIKVKVSALVNDTVGALLAHAYQAGGAFIGAIFGTGTNGAYVANIDDVKKLTLKAGDGLTRPEKMLINTEWGGFDDDAQSRADEGLPITPYDNYVDRTAIRPRHHCFEKMTSGMYLGEVCRAVILDLVDRLLLFQGRSSPAFNTQYAFDTAYVSTIVGDASSAEDLSAPTRAVLVQTMGIPDQYVSPADVAAVRKICDFVTLRAARVSAVPIAATIVHTGEDKRVRPGDRINVGVDGSVVEFVPRFQERILEAVREMVGDETADKIRFGMAKDGSGVGAALCALQAVKQAEAGHAV